MSAISTEGQYGRNCRFKDKKSVVWLLSGILYGLVAILLSRWLIHDAGSLWRPVAANGKNDAYMEKLIAAVSDLEYVAAREQYRNEQWNFSLQIPESWKGKYQVVEKEDTVYFLQTATYEKYGEGSGCLFYITRLEGVKSQEEVDEMVAGAFGRPIIMQSGEYTYVYGLPTDVQYPIWEDRDEEDILIAEEYEEMAKDIETIVKSIAPVK